MDNVSLAGRLLSDYKVTELKDELGRRSLSKTGNKQQLINRLGEYLLANPEPEAQMTADVVRSPPAHHKAKEENPFVAQYLAERESLLAENLDHKRKVQAERGSIVEENVNVQDYSIKSPSQESSGQSEEGASPSRRKNRKPERKMETEVVQLPPTPPRTRASLRSPSPRKDDLSIPVLSPKTTENISASPTREQANLEPAKESFENQAAHVPAASENVKDVKNSEEKDASVEFSPAGVVSPTSDLSREKGEISLSEANGVSRGSDSQPPVNLASQSREDESTAAAISQSAEQKESTPDLSRTHVADTSKENSMDSAEEPVDVLPPAKLERQDTELYVEPKQEDEAMEVEEQKTVATLEPVANPPERKEEAAKIVEKAGTTAVLLPRNLTESISLEEEKLDYGDEGEDELATPPKELEPPASSENASAVAKKRPASAERTVPVKADALKNDRLEPPRKMARSGLGSVSEEHKKKTENSSDVPPSRTPATKMLHIRNLVRPYQVPALKEYLRETGSIVDDPEHFWVDSIKSQCLVTYSTEEEAENTRKALWNKMWPPGSGKILLVDFVKEDEFKPISSGTPTQSPAARPAELKRTVSTSGRTQIDRAAVEKLKITVASNKETGEIQREVNVEKRAEKNKDRMVEVPVTKENVEKIREKLGERAERMEKGDRLEKPKTVEREWDRGKKFVERRDNEREQLSRPAGIPLEQLFQRTEAKPQIYWKPLTDEEVKANEEAELKITKEREERRNADRPDRNRAFSRERRRSPRRRSRSRSRGRDERGARGPPPRFGRRSPVRGRRSPSPRRFGRRRSRSISRGRRF